MQGQRAAVLPGMTGRAAIVVGRRSLASYAIEPLRQMREVAVAGLRPRPGPAECEAQLSDAVAPRRPTTIRDADARRLRDPATPPMQACLERARVAARTDLPILILGESGTGKTHPGPRDPQLVAARAAGPFVSFNAAALSETLLDSQLFGHERGAFTGAQQRVKGKFELADRGTLFLDEIADLSPPGQSKILRAVEYGEFERLGSETLQRADVRVLSATHHPLNGDASAAGSARTCSTASTASR